MDDVLGFFNIPFIINDSSRAATGRVNGSVFKVQAGVPKNDGWQIDAVGKGQEVLTVFIKPNESANMYFSAGVYILKLAS